jgi:hypothetical protein
MIGFPSKDAENSILWSMFQHIPGSLPAQSQQISFGIPFYLQSILVYSANCVKTYTMAYRRVLTSTPL